MPNSTEAYSNRSSKSTGGCSAESDMTWRLLYFSKITEDKKVQKEPIKGGKDAKNISISVDNIELESM